MKKENRKDCTAKCKAEGTVSHTAQSAVKENISHDTEIQMTGAEHSYTDAYLQELVAQIRCQKAHSAVQEELRAHIEDQKEAFLEEGMEEKEAEERAVLEMGDPVAAGIELDRVHRPKAVWGMIGLVAVMSVIGFVYQCLVRQQFPETALSGEEMLRSGLFMLGGFGLMIAVCCADYSRIGYWAKEITVFSYLALLLYVNVLGGGIEINGRMGWLDFRVFTVDIQMLLFLAVPLYGAILYSYRGKGFGGLFSALVWMLPPLLTALRMPALMTMTALFLAMLVVLTAALAKGWFRVPKKTVIAILWSMTAALPAILLAVVGIAGKGYRAERVQMRIGRMLQIFGLETPFLQQTDMYYGYRPDAVWKVLEQSKLAGGSGLPQDSFEFLGRDAYLLTHITAFYGIVAAVLLMAAIVFVIMRLFRISFRQRNQLGMMMGTGCAAVFFVKIVLYLLCNLGLIDGALDCPFLSFGGTGIGVTYILIGILLSVCRYRNVLPVNPPAKELGLRRQKI